MRIEISRSLLAKILNFVQHDHIQNRVYDDEWYEFVKLTEDESIELSMIFKELKDDIKSV